MPNRYDVILLDFGETLVDLSVDVWRSMYMPILERRGIAWTLDDFARAYGNVWARIDSGSGVEHLEHSLTAEGYDRWRGAVELQAMAELGLAEPPPGLVEDILACQDDPKRYSVFDDVRPALDALAGRGYRMGVVSNFSWCLPDILDDLGLGAYFERVIVSARAGYRKPHAGIFHAALKGLAVEPAQALHVGDSLIADVGGAGSAGIDAILLDRRGRHPEHPGAVPDLGALVDLLDA